MKENETNVNLIPNSLIFEVKYKKNRKTRGKNLHLLNRKKPPIPYWQIMDRQNDLVGKIAKSGI